MTKIHSGLPRLPFPATCNLILGGQASITRLIGRPDLRRANSNLSAGLFITEVHYDLDYINATPNFNYWQLSIGIYAPVLLGPQIVTFSPVVRTATRGNRCQRLNMVGTHTQATPREQTRNCLPPSFYIKFSTLYYIF